MSPRALAVQLMGPLYAPTRDLLLSIFSLSERTALVWVGAYVAVALAVHLYDRRAARGFLGWLFPREIYGHPSAVNDAIYFVVNKVVLFATLTFAFAASRGLGDRLAVVLPRREGPPRFWGSAVATLAIFLAFEFASFYWHWLTHRLKFLWAFHRVHHAAEVLTPLSNYREHPVDVVGRSLCVAGLMGLTRAVALHFLPAAPFEIFGINACIVPFLALANARHSHVWIDFPAAIGRVLSSPAQHQCHHGTAPEHIDVNYGNYLSLWDWLFGTLYLPRGREQVKLGLVGEAQPFPTVASMYVRPFRDAIRRKPLLKPAMQ